MALCMKKLHKSSRPDYVFICPPGIIYYLFYIFTLAFGSIWQLGGMNATQKLRKSNAVASALCFAHYFNLGEIGSGACGRHWNHPFFHALGDQGLSWSIMRVGWGDSKNRAGDGNGWWYISSTAMKWQQANKLISDHFIEQCQNEERVIWVS